MSDQGLTIRVDLTMGEYVTIRTALRYRDTRADDIVHDRLGVAKAAAEFAAQIAESKKDEQRALRAQWAKSYRLTRRNAEALASLRAGYGPRAMWYTDPVFHGWHNMALRPGGAVRRMLSNMHLAALLQLQVNGAARTYVITDLGLEKLAAWEATHRHEWPVPTVQHHAGGTNVVI